MVHRLVAHAFLGPPEHAALQVNHKNGTKSDPNDGGIAGDRSKGKFLSQIAYGTPSWQVSAAYAYSQAGMTVGGVNQSWTE